MAATKKAISIRGRLLHALEGVGQVGITKDQLVTLVPGSSTDIDALLAEGLAGHPVATTRLLILSALGKAHLALRRYTGDGQW